MGSENSRYNEIGKVEKYFFQRSSIGLDAETPNAQLTAIAYGQITLDHDFLCEKIKKQKGFLLSHVFQRPGKYMFTFQEFLVNEGVKENLHANGTKTYEYSQLINRLQHFYSEAQEYFEDPNRQMIDLNYCLLEYHLLHHVFRDPETGKFYLMLFSPIGNRETLKSRIERHPNIKPTPGQVLTLLQQISGVLRFLFMESDVYYGDENNLPLLEWSPSVSLTEIYFFGKSQFKLNLLSFVSEEQRTTSVFSHKVRNQIEKLVVAYKGTNCQFREEDKKKLYYMSLNSLFVSAVRFTMNNSHYMSTNPYPDDVEDMDYARDIDLKDLAKGLETHFVNEFKEEGELLVHFLKEISRLTLKDQVRSIFDFKTCLETCKGYLKTDPKNYTLARSFERQGMPRSKRLTELQNLFQLPDIKRETELNYIKDLVNRVLEKEKYVAVFGSDKKEASKTIKQKEKNPKIVYPYIEVEYPLDPIDISNISPNSNDEKLICQVYPLYDKDFMVYRALTTQLVVSIEFNDDLILLLCAISEAVGFINAEIDNDRRLVFRSACNLQLFENELESHIATIDELALVAILIIRKLNYCIEQEEFGRMAKNTKLIIEEIQYHLRLYREQNAQSKEEADDI